VKQLNHDQKPVGDNRLQQEGCCRWTNVAVAQKQCHVECVVSVGKGEEQAVLGVRDALGTGSRP
jgi:hypothetical protein